MNTNWLSSLASRVIVAMIGVAVPFMAHGATVDAIEYYHSGMNHYFITAGSAEAAMLDAGNVVKGWTRTGQTFKVESSQASGTSAVCRFFSTSFGALSSHFYTANAGECATVKGNPNWQFESVEFYAMTPTQSGTCTSGTPVYRLYNNGQGGAPNHRLTTSSSVRTTMMGQGWVPEGYGIGVSLCSSSSSGGTSGNAALTKSNQLVGGTWAFDYTYGSHYTDTFKFTSIDANTGSNAATGPYNVWGTNRYGKSVLARFYLDTGKFLLVSPLGSYWDYYIFDFTSANAINGCYYFDNNVGNPFDDPCTSLVGLRLSSDIELFMPGAIEHEPTPKQAQSFALRELVKSSSNSELPDLIREMRKQLENARPF